jgi:hypothetical protein
MFHRSKIGLLTTAIAGIGLLSYTGMPREVADILGMNDDALSIVRELPGDITDVVKQVYETIGNPRDNFQQAMTGFENVAHRNNPQSGGHGDYSRIYEVMDIQSIISELKKLKIQQYYCLPDSQLIQKYYSNMQP